MVPVPPVHRPVLPMPLPCVTYATALWYLCHRPMLPMPPLYVADATVLCYRCHRSMLPMPLPYVTDAIAAVAGTCDHKHGVAAARASMPPCVRAGVSCTGAIFFFLHTLLISSFWTSRGHRCRPFSLPVLAFNFLSRIGFSNPTARRFFIECC